MIRKQNQKSAAQKVADFLQTNWIVLVVLLVGLPWAIKYLKTMFNSIAEQQEEADKDREFRENRDSQTLDEKMNSYLSTIPDNLISNSKNSIKRAASRFAHDLGTLYSDTDSWWSWADPRGWTENDKFCVDLVEAAFTDFPYIAVCYKMVTRSRNLYADVVKYLPASELDRLRHNGYDWL